MDVNLEQNCEWTFPSLISRIAVSHPLLSCNRDELLTEAARMRDAGIRNVNIRRQQLLHIGTPVVSEILSDAGLSVRCVGFAGGFTGTMSMDHERAIADARQAVRLAKSLGAKSLVVLTGGQGIHTYRHAETSIRMALNKVSQLADLFGIRLLIPTDSLLTDTRDVFRPKLSPLNWIMQMQIPAVRPLIVVRGKDSGRRIPRGWRKALEQGGAIRICPNCPYYTSNVRQLQSILQFIERADDGASRFAGLVAERP